MSEKHPTPWTLIAEDEFEDSPILDKNGDYVLVRDSGCYPPDLDTCREIVEAVNAFSATPHGDAAAMRDVIEQACCIIRCYQMSEADGEFPDQDEEVCEWFKRADAALAAPDRN